MKEVIDTAFHWSVLGCIPAFLISSLCFSYAVVHKDRKYVFHFGAFTLFFAVMYFLGRFIGGIPTK